jgi:outer membrane murein-binding lipoprotein Lpp
VASKPDPVVPPKARTPVLVPALLGLVAGGAGGFAAWNVTDYFSPRVGTVAPVVERRLAVLEQTPRSAATGEIPVALVDRIARAEAAVVAATQREAQLREELGKLSAGLSSEAQERTKALAALAERGANAPATAAQVVIPVPEANRDVEQLRARIGSVESAAGALPSAIGTVAAKADSVASRVDQIAPKLDQMNVRVETLAPKIDAAGEQVAALARTVSGLANRDALARATGLVSATGLLSEALERGQALSGPVAILQSLGLGADQLIAFSPFADHGAPNAAKLLADLRAVRPPQAQAASSGDIVERMRSGLSNFVEVRRTGQVTGTDDPSQIAIAEQALGRGDLPTAIAAIAKLSAERAPAFAAWRASAEQRLRAGETAARLRQSAFTALRDAAAGTAKP